MNVILRNSMISTYSIYEQTMADKLAVHIGARKNAVLSYRLAY